MEIVRECPLCTWTSDDPQAVRCPCGYRTRAAGWKTAPSVEPEFELLADDERFDLRAGDVLECVPYTYDPHDKLTVLRRVSDGMQPSCNVYRSQVRRVRAR